MSPPQNPSRTTLRCLRADGLLLLAALIWGSGFVAQRMGMAHVGPLTYTGVRFALGAVVLLPVIAVRHRKRSAAMAGSWAAGVKGGLLCGVVLFAGASLQQIGLVYTTAGKAGFITGLYVIFVPLLGLVIRHVTPAGTWLGAGLAAGGLYLLSVRAAFEVNPGDAFVLACAVVWAVHVLLIGRLSPGSDPLILAAVQFSVGSVLAGLLAVATETITLQSLVAARWPILYGGVLSAGVAFTLQVVAQRQAPPAHAAVLLSFEAVFAALAGYLILGEILDARELAGCALMFTGILVSQVRGMKKVKSMK